MEIVRDDAGLDRYIREAVVVSGASPVLIDSYLSSAVEVDVDALSDGERVHVAGVIVITSYSIHYTKLYERQAGTDHRDEVGGRGHGHRPLVP